MMSSKLKYLILIALAHQYSYTNAQEFNSINLKKIQVGIFTSWNSFFDQNPIIQTKYSNYNISKWLSNSKGIEISYFPNKKSAYRISIDKINIDYLEHVTGTKSGYSGYIFKRDFTRYRIEALLNLFEKNHISVFAKAGGLVRTGAGETALISYGNYDVLSKLYKTQDVGLSFGSQLNTLLNSKFNISVAINYNRYFYRTDTGNPHLNNWDNGSSKQSFDISLGIGYRFHLNSQL